MKHGRLDHNVRIQKNILLLLISLSSISICESIVKVVIDKTVIEFIFLFEITRATYKYEGCKSERC